MSDVTWWKRDLGGGRHQDEPVNGNDVPGDTNASDIVGRTGEEMPDIAHDEGDFDLPITDDSAGEMTTFPPEADEFRGS